MHDTTSVADDATEDVAGTQMPLTNQTKNLGTIAHLSAFVLFLGIPSLFGPLAMWLFNRDNPHVEFHAREALNFNLSMAIYGIASAVLILFAVGLLLLPIVFVGWFVLTIVASVKASNGEYYRYPFTNRIVN